MKAIPDIASIKAMAVDLDGTLLTSDNRVTEESLRTIAQVRARGTKLVLATARTERGCEDIAALFSPDAVISCSGSLARAGNTNVFAKPLSAAHANRVIAACKALGARISALTEDGLYLVNYPKVHPYSVETDFADPLSVGAYHVTVLLPDPAAAEDIAGAVECASFCFSDSAWVRFGHAQASKENALKALLARWGIMAEEAIAFGDDTVDIGMLKLCGYSVAMGNAGAAVKASADWISETNNQDGVAVFLKRVLGNN